MAIGARTKTLALLLLALPGCKHCDLVEAELRYQNARVRELETIVLQRDAEIHTLRCSLDAMESEPSPSKPTPEAVYQNQAMSQLSLGPSTGGRDIERDGRDDALQVLLTPHDYDGDPFKCPGSARITLYQVEKTGVKRPIGDWNLTPDDLRGQWRVSLVGQGYQLVLPWQTAPASPNLRVVAKFTTIDGRAFEAERDFSVSLQAKSGTACSTSGPALTPPSLAQGRETPSAAVGASGPKLSAEAPIMMPVVVDGARTSAPPAPMPAPNAPATRQTSRSAKISTPTSRAMPTPILAPREKSEDEPVRLKPITIGSAKAPTPRDPTNVVSRPAKADPPLTVSAEKRQEMIAQRIRARDRRPIVRSTRSLSLPTDRSIVQKSAAAKALAKDDRPKTPIANDQNVAAAQFTTPTSTGPKPAAANVTVAAFELPPPPPVFSDAKAPSPPRMKPTTPSSAKTARGPALRLLAPVVLQAN